MRVKIDIDTKTFIRFGLVLLGFVAVLGAIYFSLNALVIIGIALFSALALNPPVTWLANRMPGKSRIGATAVAYLLVVTAITTLSFLVIPPIIEQTAKFAKTVPALIDKATSQRVVFDDFINNYGLRDTVNQSIENAKKQAAEASDQLGALLVNGVATAFNGLLNLVFILILGFFMLVEGPIWIKKIWDLYDDVERLESHRATVNKMYRVVTGFVTGQITVAAIGATSAFVALLIMSAIAGLDVPANLAMPLAVVIFMMALIPMIGTTIGGGLVSLVLLLNSPAAALAFVIYFVIYQQIENNFIAPPIQSKSVELSVLWILIAIIVGSSLFGLIGGLVSIPIAGCMRVLLVDYLDRAKKLRDIDSKKGRIAKLIDKVKEA